MIVMFLIMIDDDLEEEEEESCTASLRKCYCFVKGRGGNKRT